MTLCIAGCSRNLPTHKHKTFKLESHDFTIILGRGPKVRAPKQAGKYRVYIQNPIVSSLHAEIKFVAAEVSWTSKLYLRPLSLRQSKFYLSDTKSLYGTKLNGRSLLPHEEIELHGQDVVTLGKTVIVNPSMRTPCYSRDTSY